MNIYLLLKILAGIAVVLFVTAIIKDSAILYAITAWYFGIFLFGWFCMIMYGVAKELNDKYKWF
jgi:hypothetical protein